MLLAEVLARVRESSVGDVVVVTGAHEVETEARVVPCPEWERGADASLRCGLRELPPEVQARRRRLGRGPDLSPEAIDRVIEVWRESAAEVVAATYGGQRLHPVLLARSVWEEIPDEGARKLPGSSGRGATTSNLQETSTLPMTSQRGSSRRPANV